MIIQRHQVVAALARHVGRENGVRIQDLVREITGEPQRDEHHERRVRAIVAELRGEGEAICAHPSVGYHVAASPEELDECCRYLRSRWIGTAVLEARLRKIALPELLGQLRLKT